MGWVVMMAGINFRGKLSRANGPQPFAHPPVPWLTMSGWTSNGGPKLRRRRQDSVFTTGLHRL